MNKNTSRIVGFYRGTGTDHRGRTLDEILSFDDRSLESTHDYIQWLFPLTEPSQFNSQAPLLTHADIETISFAPELQANVVRAFERMLSFYGFEMPESGGSLNIRTTERFKAQAANWRTPGNHNYLRITRILKSLRLLGLAPHADAFLAALETVYAEAPEKIGERTLSFWRRA
jgi:hypothetical protein